MNVQKKYIALGISIIIVLLMAGILSLRARKQYTSVETPPTSVTKTPTKGEVAPGANIPGWKQYVNKQIGYSIAVPASWSAEIYENTDLLKHPPGVTNYRFTPENGMRSGNDPEVASMDITYPYHIKGTLQELENRNYMGNESEIASYTKSYTTIDGHKALITKSVSKPAAMVTLPPGFAGDAPCDACVRETVFIDMGGGNIFEVNAYWGNKRKEFEPLFDKALTTLTFTK